MKNYCLLPLLLSCFVGFAQPKLVLKGTIMSENFALQKIEIINLDTENIVSSNANGYFEIEIKAGNILVIGNASYNYQTIKIKKEDIENPNFKVFLTRKTEELEEVVVNNLKMPKIKFDQAAIDANKIKKANTFPNNINNQNQIPNGANLIAIGKLFGKLFKSIFNVEPKKAEKIIPKVDIQSYIAKNLKPDYLTETLQIKPEETYLFFEFCKADAACKAMFETENIFLIMNFLSTKNGAFKKIPK